MNSVNTLISEAQDLLRQFGFDSIRTNKRSAMVLLALLQLKPGDAWSQAQNPLLGLSLIHI